MSAERESFAQNSRCGPLAPAFTSTTCPASQIADRYADLAAVEKLLLMKASTASDQRARGVYSDTATQDCHDSFSDLMELASLTPATSLDGALFQVAVLAWLVDGLLEFVDRESDKDTCRPGPSAKWHVDRLERNIDRMLWSIREVLEKATGIDLRNVGADRVMPDYCRHDKTPQQIIARADDQAAQS